MEKPKPNSGKSNRAKTPASTPAAVPQNPKAQQPPSSPAPKPAAPPAPAKPSPAAATPPPAKPAGKPAAAPTPVPTAPSVAKTQGPAAPTAPAAAAPAPTKHASPEARSKSAPPAPAAATKTPPPPAPPAPAAPAKPPSPAPGILLEDDTTRAPAAGGPGDRYVLGAAALRAAGIPGSLGELPAAYGTGRLLLLARDPHWVYAHWDLTDEQLRDYNRKSADGHLVLRIHAGEASGRPLAEQDVHPESRNWFLHVPTAGATYVAELGYRGPRKSWTRISLSSPTLTPTEDLSPETWVHFETLPFDVPMATLVQLVREALPGHPPLVEAIAELRARGFIQLPPPATLVSGATWTPEQEHALAQVLSMDEVRRVWIGSLEITELLRRQLIRGLSSGEVPVSSQAGGPGGPSSLASLSSPFGGAGPGARGFWFNVNAELIVYGATDPHATVRIGDRTIRLRPDGSFSYRFALPDGQYPLPIRATSPDGVETRSAELAFERTSRYHGDVGTHPQDERLRPPTPEHVA